jgi:MYXO-CTERM domain-containing protein
VRSQTAQEEEYIYTDAFVGDRSWNGREHNQLLLNRGDGTFVEVGAALGLDGVADGRGLAAADFDRDGDVDFVVNNYRAQATYSINTLGQRRSWLALRLEGTHSNRDGIGAVVTVRAGDLVQTRVVGAGHGFASQFSLEQVVGLGDATEVDSVRVRWPSGRHESFGPYAVGQRLRLIEGAGVSVASDPGPAPAPWPLSLAVALLGLAGFLVVLRR